MTPTHAEAMEALKTLNTMAEGFVASMPDMASEKPHFDKRVDAHKTLHSYLEASGEPVAWRLTHENPEIDESFIAVPDKNGTWAAQGFKVEPLYLHPTQGEKS